MRLTPNTVVRTIGSLATMAAATTCWSQGSVTLYGVADAGIEYVNHLPGNGSSSVRLSTGNCAYAAVGYTINKGSANLGFFDGGKSYGNTNPGQNQFGSVIGMRHSF